MSNPAKKPILVLLFLGAAFAGPHASAYYDFTEDFNSTETPWMLEPTYGSPGAVFDGARAVFGETSYSYLRTKERDFLITDFSLEVSFELGEGEDWAWVGTDDTPSFSCQVSSNRDPDTGGRDFSLADEASGGRVAEQVKSTTSGQGTYRMRVTWKPHQPSPGNKVRRGTVTCELAENYESGKPFEPTLRLGPMEIDLYLVYKEFDNPSLRDVDLLVEENSPIKFGGRGGVAFDDLVVTGTGVAAE